MQLNKVLKSLILILPVVVLVACSSSGQSGMDDVNSGGLPGGSTGMNVSSGNLTPEQQARLQAGQLQQNNTLYFGLDKYNIEPEYTDILDQHAAFLRDNPSYRVTIEGYTDERGTPEYNIALGERRANAVRMYLQGRGVPSDQISIISYGKEKPAVFGYGEAAFAKNRRAIIVY